MKMVAKLIVLLEAAIFGEIKDPSHIPDHPGTFSDERDPKGASRPSVKNHFKSLGNGMSAIILLTQDGCINNGSGP